MTHWLFDSWPSSLSVTLSQSTAGTWHIPPQLYPPSLSCRISRMSSWWLRPELFRKVMWNNHKQWTFIDIHKLKKHGKGSTQKENIHTHTHTSHHKKMLLKTPVEISHSNSSRFFVRGTSRTRPLMAGKNDQIWVQACRRSTKKNTTQLLTWQPCYKCGTQQLQDVWL